MAMASSPLVASPTTAKPSIRRTTALAAERKGAWSSTTSTGSAVSMIGNCFTRYRGPDRELARPCGCGYPVAWPPR